MKRKNRKNSKKQVAQAAPVVEQVAKVAPAAPVPTPSKNITNTLQIGDVIVTRNPQGSYPYKRFGDSIGLQDGESIRIILDKHETLVNHEDGSYTATSYSTYNGKYGIASDVMFPASTFDGRTMVIGTIEQHTYDSKVRKCKKLSMGDVLPLEQCLLFDSILWKKVALVRNMMVGDREDSQVDIDCGFAIDTTIDSVIEILCNN